MASASITVKLRWKWIPADGSACRVCKETAWMKHLQLTGEIAGKEDALDFILCSSCADGLDLPIEDE